MDSSNLDRSRRSSRESHIHYENVARAGGPLSISTPSATSFFHFNWDDFSNEGFAPEIIVENNFSRDMRNAQDPFNETLLDSLPFCIEPNPTDQLHENCLRLENYSNNAESCDSSAGTAPGNCQRVSRHGINSIHTIVQDLGNATHIVSHGPDQINSKAQRVNSSSASSTPSVAATASPIQQGSQRNESFKKLAPYPEKRNLFIQPKLPIVENPPRGFNTQVASHVNQGHPYSRSGFDSLGILSRIANRPEPKINIGPVDLSCAFVLCEISRFDCPIVHVSEAFERLTGYSHNQIIGRNCRFLQDPQGNLEAGSKRLFVDSHTVERLRSTIHGLSEIQARIINYRRGGRAFVNLITMIPIKWDAEFYQYYVGFQVDLLNKDIAGSRFGQKVDYRQNFLEQYFLTMPTPPGRLRPTLPAELDQDDVTKTLIMINSKDSRQNLGRMMIENADDMIYILSNNGDFLYLSPACRTILGYEPNELVSKSLSTVCHPSDMNMVMRELKSSLLQFAMTFRIRRRHGNYAWLESHGSWLVDPAKGRKYAVIGGRPCLMDFFRQEIAFSPLPQNEFWAHVSLSGVILFLSSRTEKLLGYSPDESIGQTFLNVFKISPPEKMSEALHVAGYWRQNVSHAYADLEDSGRSPTFSHLILHKNGTLLPAQTTILSGSHNSAQRPIFLMTYTQLVQVQNPSSEREVSRAFPREGESDLVKQKGSSSFCLQTNSNGSTFIQSARRVAGGQSLPHPTSFDQVRIDWNSAYDGCWKTELSDLKKQNCMLAGDLRRLVQRQRERATQKLKETFLNQCANCGINQSPEWRRGPSGKRDLCNRCGLRWARRARLDTKV